MSPSVSARATTDKAQCTAQRCEASSAGMHAANAAASLNASDTATSWQFAVEATADRRTSAEYSILLQALRQQHARCL